MVARRVWIRLHIGQSRAEAKLSLPTRPNLLLTSPGSHSRGPEHDGVPMADVSKLTTDRLKHSMNVAAGIDVHGEAIARGLATSPLAPPEGLVLTLFAWLKGTLAATEGNLREADIAHAVEATDDAEPRSRRDLAARQARIVLVSASDSVRGIFGEGVSRSLGLETSLPDRPDQVNHLAEGIVKSLLAAAAPTPLFEGASMSLEALAARIEAARRPLQAAINDVSREERELQATMSERDKATARWSRAYAGVAMIVSGMATLAGLDDLAAKVKPTERKRAGIPEEGEG